MLRIILIGLFLIGYTTQTMAASPESIQFWKNAWKDAPGADSLIDNVARHYSSQSEFDTQMTALGTVVLLKGSNALSEQKQTVCMFEAILQTGDMDVAKISWVKVLACAVR